MLEPPRPSLIKYPETDGQPMTESDATRAYLIYCISALRLFFQSRPQVYVSGNLFIYYEEGKPQKSISPDVFVIFGVNKRERRSYKTWQEGGKLPSFVLEITSLSTQKQDEEIKPKLYASLEIPEYFQYDPTGDYLPSQLKGQRLVNGQYEPIAPETLADGSLSLHSQMLGLDLRLLPPQAPLAIAHLLPIARELRLFDPQSGAQLLTYEEAEQARLNAEQKIADLQTQSAEAQAQQKAAEQQLAELRDKLRSHGIDPDTL
ncbi:Uma2 family endonuclease [Leptolyngbya sp. O-77]|uniref:Uma2 family endonuclease n=1 Tax=Leptolyngbya sp. O-77 TaxID=1080068 RepID=UPI00074D41AC|nr:Uma2 family endonuclease [Leptolyngbya sp. O-77]BAU41121.1 hypothetical protein O77CONTIG1_00928 [Leptolyngbya sp. O-77]